MINCFTKYNKKDAPYVYCLTGTQAERYNPKKKTVPKKKPVPKKETKKPVPKKETKKPVPKKETKKPVPKKETKSFESGIVNEKEKILRLEHIDKIKTSLKKVLSRDLQRKERENFEEQLDIAIEYEQYLNRILRVDTNEKIKNEVIKFIESFRKKK